MGDLMRWADGQGVEPLPPARLTRFEQRQHGRSLTRLEHKADLQSRAVELESEIGQAKVHAVANVGNAAMTAQALISGRERLLVEAEPSAIHGGLREPEAHAGPGRRGRRHAAGGHEVIELVLLVGLVLLVVGVLVAASNSAVDDARSSMEEAARRERHRVTRAQTRAENEINRLTHAAFEEMVEVVDRARREADS